MATANNTSPNTAKTTRPAKRTSARGSSAKSAGATQAKSTRAKAARTRAVNQTESALKSTETAARSTVDLVGDYAERAVLIPVGAALTARDLVVSSVGEVISSYSSPSKAQLQLRKFERRGGTARNRLEREVRKTRTRVERELRQRRGDLEGRRDSVSKSISKQVEQTQTQIESAVQARLKDGAELASRVQERVLNLV
jgi:vacuolar-type H+-ATPase subunit E/Vma4